MSRHSIPQTTPKDTETTPFSNAEEAWFWFIQANQAKQDGARQSASQGDVIRPCESVDILNILERLHRHRRLDMNHFRVLRHYGVRMMAPDIRRPHEAAAARLWREAMGILNDVLVDKGIVRQNLANEVIWIAHLGGKGRRASW